MILPQREAETATPASLVREDTLQTWLDLLRFETFHEGLSMQIMHFGPYSDESATIARMHAFASEHDYRLRGKHHEIYLGDPRRSDPAKLKTVLRQPVELLSVHLPGCSN